VRTLRDIALKADEKDTFLLFFAGHGLQSPLGGSHWVTQDATLESIEIDGIRLGHVVDFVEMIKARHKLLILDHCFSGEIVLEPALTAPRAATTVAAGSGAVASPSLRARHLRPAEDGMKKQLGPPRRDVIVLAASWDLAYEQQNTGHGYLTNQILRALRTKVADTNDNDVENEGLLSSEELVLFVQRLVPGVQDLEEVPQLPEAWHTGNELYWPFIDLSTTADQVRASVTRFREVTRALGEKQLIDVRVLQRSYNAIDNWQRNACPTTVVKDDAGVARCNQGAAEKRDSLDLLDPGDYEIIGLLSRLAGSGVAPERQASLVTALVDRLAGGPP
jgi:hypothetical protein